ncbi:MAG: hypothetical protein O2909_07020 [Chloroflexi bacterium]|nr:hypothetical protein [Chloroflexota bacterium]MDA1219175.1 hypothetical protein [Chloroflexota bacterium]
MANSRTWKNLVWILAGFTLTALVIGCGQAVAPTSEPPGDHADVPPGVVQPQPAGAIQVDVKLAEWAVIPNPAEIQNGQIYFLAENIGPSGPHELVVIKTNLAPDQLPNVDGKVDEGQVELIGELEEFAVGSKASGVFNLAAGNYVLICNIVELEDGELESHYLKGMRTAFIVR